MAYFTVSKPPPYSLFLEKVAYCTNSHTFLGSLLASLAQIHTLLTLCSEPKTIDGLQIESVENFIRSENKTFVAIFQTLSL
jgi:hypothetical protein